MRTRAHGGGSGEALAGNYCRCGTHYTAVESTMAYVDPEPKEEGGAG